jgi:hypothetical protein
MTTKADDRRRIVVPQVEPGQVYAIQDNGGGSFTLTPVKRAEPAIPKFKLVKENGFTVIETDRHVSLETIKELLAEFP